MTLLFCSDVPISFSQLPNWDEKRKIDRYKESRRKTTNKQKKQILYINDDDDDPYIRTQGGNIRNNEENDGFLSNWTIDLTNAPIINYRNIP